MNTGPSLTKRIRRSVAYSLIRMFVFFFRLLPLEFACRLGRLAGEVAWMVFRRERKKGIENCIRSDKAPDEARKIVKAAFARVGWKVVEAVNVKRILTLPSLSIQAEGEHLLRALACSGGGIAFTAHYGNWELLAAWAVATGLPLTVLARPLYDPRLSQWVRKERENIGVETLYAEGSAYLRKVLEALRRGRIVAVLPDARPYGDRVCEVSFLGGSMVLPLSPFKLALRNQNRPVVAFIRQDGWSFRYHILVRKIEGSSPEELAQNYACHLEEVVKEKPEDWIWWLR